MKKSEIISFYLKDKFVNQIQIKLWKDIQLISASVSQNAIKQLIKILKIKVETHPQHKKMSSALASFSQQHSINGIDFHNDPLQKQNSNQLKKNLHNTSPNSQIILSNIQLKTGEKHQLLTQQCQKSFESPLEPSTLLSENKQNIYLNQSEYGKTDDCSLNSITSISTKSLTPGILPSFLNYKKVKTQQFQSSQNADLKNEGNPVAIFPSMKQQISQQSSQPIIQSKDLFSSEVLNQKKYQQDSDVISSQFQKEDDLLRGRKMKQQETQRFQLRWLSADNQQVVVRLVDPSDFFEQDEEKNQFNTKQKNQFQFQSIKPPVILPQKENINNPNNLSISSLPKQSAIDQQPYFESPLGLSTKLNDWQISSPSNKLTTINKLIKQQVSNPIAFSAEVFNRPIIFQNKNDNSNLSFNNFRNDQQNQSPLISTNWKSVIDTNLKREEQIVSNTFHSNTNFSEIQIPKNLPLQIKENQEITDINYIASPPCCSDNNDDKKQAYQYSKSPLKELSSSFATNITLNSSILIPSSKKKETFSMEISNSSKNNNQLNLSLQDFSFSLNSSNNKQSNKQSILLTKELQKQLDFGLKQDFTFFNEKISSNSSIIENKQKEHEKSVQTDQKKHLIPIKSEIINTFDFHALSTSQQGISSISQSSLNKIQDCNYDQAFQQEEKVLQYKDNTSKNSKQLQDNNQRYFDEGLKNEDFKKQTHINKSTNQQTEKTETKIYLQENLQTYKCTQETKGKEINKFKQNLNATNSENSKVSTLSDFADGKIKGQITHSDYFNAQNSHSLTLSKEFRMQCNQLFTIAREFIDPQLENKIEMISTSSFHLLSNPSICSINAIENNSELGQEEEILGKIMQDPLKADLKLNQQDIQLNSLNQVLRQEIIQVQQICEKQQYSTSHGSNQMLSQENIIMKQKRDQIQSQKIQVYTKILEIDDNEKTNEQQLIPRQNRSSSINSKDKMISLSNPHSKSLSLLNRMPQNISHSQQKPQNIEKSLKMKCNQNQRRQSLKNSFTLSTNISPSLDKKEIENKNSQRKNPTNRSPAAFDQQINLNSKSYIQNSNHSFPSPPKVNIKGMQLPKSILMKEYQKKQLSILTEKSQTKIQDQLKQTNINEKNNKYENVRKQNLSFLPAPCILVQDYFQSRSLLSPKNMQIDSQKSGVRGFSYQTESINFIKINKQRVPYSKKKGKRDKNEIFTKPEEYNMSADFSIKQEQIINSMQQNIIKTKFLKNCFL